MLFALCTQAAAAGTEPETEPAVELPILLPASDSYYPTPWYDGLSSERTIPVANDEISVISALIGSVGVGAKTGIAGAAIAFMGQILLANFISGYFPDGYYITIDFDQRYRILTPALPMTIEYEETMKIYGGPASNPYKTLFYSGEDAYTDYVYVRAPSYGG